MAYGCNDLLRVEHVLYQLEGFGLDAQEIWVDLAARQDDGVVIGSGNLIERLVDLYGTTPILLVPPFDFAGLQRHDFDGGASLLERVAGHLELRLLKALGRKDCHSFAGQFHASLLVYWVRAVNRRWRASFQPASSPLGVRTYGSLDGCSRRACLQPTTPGSIGQLTHRKKPVTPADFRNVVPAFAVAPMGGQSGADHADRFRQIIRTLPKMRSVAHGRP